MDIVEPYNAKAAIIPDTAVLTVLYRDAHLIAIDKPAGLLVHRSDVDRHETRFAVQLLRDQIGRRVQPVHRLDRGTSGVLLFAFDAEAARTLGRQFEDESVHKEYRAVVRGWPPEAGSIDHALARRHDDYGRPLPTAAPQPALTRYRRLATVELPCAVEGYATARYACVALEPQSGRRHQLRRHLAHIAHPVIGDATYGRGRHNRFFRQQFGCGRLLLACTAMRFRHPADGREMTVRAPLGGEFAAVVERLGWSRAVSDAAREREFVS